MTTLSFIKTNLIINILKINVFETGIKQNITHFIPLFFQTVVLNIRNIHYKLFKQ